MHDSSHSIFEEHWVIWNGALGVLDTVMIARLEATANGRSAWLDEPYDMVGPFSFDELEAQGCIQFAACLVMSRQKWQQDQVELRRESHKLRRAAAERLAKEQARFQNRRQQAHPLQRHRDQQHRELLKLPINGELKQTQIKSAYRRLAQKMHPDVGGNPEQFVEITAARDALLEYAS